VLKFLSHAAHVLGEAALGLLAVLAIGGCVAAWRLAQGPIDITPLVVREHRLLNAKGAHVTIGRASLAWEGFAETGQPLDVVVEDVAARVADGGGVVELHRARVGLSIPQLLLGRIAPRAIAVDGAAILVVVGSMGVANGLPLGTPFKYDGNIAAATPPWMRQLGQVRLHDVALTLRGVLPGADIQAPHAVLDLVRLGDRGMTGSAHVELVAGAVRAGLDLQAAVRDGGTQFTGSVTQFSPAALAALSPALSDLRALDAPVSLALQASLGPTLQFAAGKLDLTAGAGTVRAGFGSVAIAGLAASLSASPRELRLEHMRVALAAPSGFGLSGLPPPTITARATATRQAGRVHATFGVDIDTASMADLPWYWPEGTGGGTRDWMAQNVTQGRAHDAHVSGTLDARMDFSDAQLTSLSGGLVADDLTVFWLRPVPGLEHGQARLTIEGPDALRVVMDKGGEKGLSLQPGAFVRVTGLSTPHQFADIDAGLSGALPDALTMLNHPRLALLSRSGLEMGGASGDVAAHLILHVPLEDNVTLDDMAIGATATLHRVHLGQIVGGRDLDRGELSLKISGGGLTAGGTGEVSGVPAKLGLDMDFRGGPPSQVLQHATASGTVSPVQLIAAGVPEGAAHLLSAGSAGFNVDYAGRRDGGAALQVDADLARAAVTTPLGWSKPVGPPARAGGQVTLSHGRLTGVENLHAEGPGLTIVSRAQLRDGNRILSLDRMEVGQTRARGLLAFPADPKLPIRVSLSGSLLDLSSQLDPAKPAPKRPTQPEPPPEDNKPGPKWTASLKFDQVELAHGKVLAPFTVDAEDDGLRILHAQLLAGAHGEMSASIVPRAGGRSVSISASDAGVALRALDVADNIYGGKLMLEGAYDDAKPGSPLTGTATLSEFNIRNAPSIGRLLQAMTLYGMADLARGPGLHFSKMVAPFRWQRRMLTLMNARAFSASLGITAQGNLDLRRQTADITGTVVPAYFFNQLLGDLPVVGRIFSPEKGGGLFAARYSLRGPLDQPKVGINPLSALTPGFLREGFGLLAPKPVAPR
jgi:hypothetical protein